MRHATYEHEDFIQFFGVDPDSFGMRKKKSNHPLYPLNGPIVLF